MIASNSGSEKDDGDDDDVHEEVQIQRVRTPRKAEKAPTAEASGVASNGDDADSDGTMLTEKQSNLSIEIPVVEVGSTRDTRSLPPSGAVSGAEEGDGTSSDDANTKTTKKAMRRGRQMRSYRDESEGTHSDKSESEATVAYSDEEGEESSDFDPDDDDDEPDYEDSDDGDYGSAKPAKGKKRTMGSAGETGTKPGKRPTLQARVSKGTSSPAGRRAKADASQTTVSTSGRRPAASVKAGPRLGGPKSVVKPSPGSPGDAGPQSRQMTPSVRRKGGLTLKDRPSSAALPLSPSPGPRRGLGGAKFAPPLARNKEGGGPGASSPSSIAAATVGTSNKTVTERRSALLGGSKIAAGGASSTKLVINEGPSSGIRPGGPTIRVGLARRKAKGPSLHAYLKR